MNLDPLPNQALSIACWLIPIGLIVFWDQSKILAIVPLSAQATPVKILGNNSEVDRLFRNVERSREPS